LKTYQYNEAVAILMKILEKDFENGEAHALMVEIYSALGT